MKRLILLLVALTSTSGCMSILPSLAPKVKSVEEGISPKFDFESKFIEVKGSKMHYVEMGEGDPIVLLHGNPTSSYLWRNIIPALSKHGRVIAFDMIGMGKSDKPDLAYRFTDHADHAEAFIETLGLKDLTLVLHDWGGAVGVNYAAKHPDNVKAIAFMEALVRPMKKEDAGAVEHYMFGQLRDEKRGTELIVGENYFIEKALAMFAGRALSDAEMKVYRAPYLKEKDRLPVAMWPKEIPIDGTPADNAAIMQKNYDWMRGSSIPLLLLYANPGAIIKAPMVADFKRALPNLEAVSIGPGAHYVQETSPTRIAEALSKWLVQIDSSR